MGADAPRVLVLTNLYPTPVDPVRGIFVHQMVRQLAKRCDVEVVCPLPWFPRIASGKIFERWQQYAQVPSRYDVDGITVHSPKYFMLPKVSEAIHSALVYLRLAPFVAALRRRRAFDVLNAHWLFPDGVAAGWIARRLGVPLVLGGRGCDVNLFLGEPAKRPQIMGALARAAAVTVVSSGLRDRLVQEGVPGDKVTVIPNGIDTQLFHPRDKAATRRQLGFPGQERMILFVGQLLEVKGVTHLLDAVRVLRDQGERFQLCLAGEGELRTVLKEFVERNGLRDRVRFLGNRPHAEIALWLGAADLLCLPSIREGCPNVVLEALASGRPVVGSRVGGIPEHVREENGVLSPPRDPEALARALKQALDRSWDARAIAQTVAHLSWEGAAGRYLEVLRRAITA
jgi:glycosyltransferase involved in cell wall biosynthesis